MNCSYCHCTLHSVELQNFTLNIFFAEIPWNQCVHVVTNYSVMHNVFTKYFSNESKILIFPHCVLSFILMILKNRNWCSTRKDTKFRVNISIMIYHFLAIIYALLYFEILFSRKICLHFSEIFLVIIYMYNIWRHENNERTRSILNFQQRLLDLWDMK